MCERWSCRRARSSAQVSEALFEGKVVSLGSHIVCGYVGEGGEQVGMVVGLVVERRAKETCGPAIRMQIIEKIFLGICSRVP